MDIFRFIESKDIADHIRKTGHQLSELEQAWLIWYCKDAKRSERHTAWEYLIQHGTDCSVETSDHRQHWDSLHQMLHFHISLENKLEEFLRRSDPKTVYVAELKEKAASGCGHDWYWCGGKMLSSYEKAMAYAMAEASPEHTLAIRICKYWCDSDSGIQGEYSPNGEPTTIECRGEAVNTLLTQDEKTLYYDSFDELWLDIPFPFQKGDIVQHIHTKEPFVLLDTDLWRKQRHPNRSVCRNIGDMMAHGYSYDPEEHFLDDDAMCCYLDLEYRKEPLTGGERILDTYSRFVKGEIDEWTLMKFGRMYHCEEIAEADRKQLKSFGSIKERL